MVDRWPERWDPAGLPAFTCVVDTARVLFDPALVARLAAIPADPRTLAISNRLIIEIGNTNPGDPHPQTAYRAAFDAAKARNPAALVFVPGDEFGHDAEWELNDLWTAAANAAFFAAEAYLYPYLITPDESVILRKQWETVFGPPRTH